MAEGYVTLPESAEALFALPDWSVHCVTGLPITLAETVASRLCRSCVTHVSIIVARALLNSVGVSTPS